MDPLTALSVAGTIIQFVDFGSNLLKNSIQLYNSSRGSLKGHEELKLVTGDLQCVIAKLRGSFSARETEPVPPLAGNKDFQQNIERICDEAARIATELLKKLNSLMVKDGEHRRWKSLKAAVKAAWSHEEIQSLEKRLLLLKESLHSGSIHLLGQNIDAAFILSSGRFDTLETQTQQILEAIVNTKESLPHDLFEFLTKLLCRSESLNQDEHRKTRQMIADLRHGKTPSSGVDVITAEIEMLSVGHKDEKLLRRTLQKTVLDLLQYPYMTDRYEQLVEAHPQTFDWIFCSSDKWQYPWTDFGKWLKEDQGIYWINGKPASGKSTLMKHIYDDRRTNEYLQQWSRKGKARPVPCCLVTFFFWSTGTAMQKSQEGLLRSLLFQVLGQYPDLIPLVFPASRQLHDAFERLIRQTLYPLNICFCIDGLDEFSGDAERLCLFFKRMSSISKTAKLCLSSRPWVEFKHNFEDCASLRLQDLTANDISTYVNGKLRASAAFTQLTTRDKDLASKLSNEIMDRAQGVFLWVKIVVDLLLKGINNRDTIPQLWTRLESIPTELYSLYESLLSQIDPIYFDWASKSFQTMVASARLSYDPFRKSTFREAGQDLSGGAESSIGVSPITLIEFSFALQEDYCLDSTKVMSTSQLLSQCEETLVHLTARCAGFLEFLDLERLNELSALFGIIRWMHRTAHDFVRGRATWGKAINDDCFRDPQVCCRLMKASCISLKELADKLGNPMASEGQEKAFFHNAMIYAYYADGHLPTRGIRSKLLSGLWSMEISAERSALLLIQNKLVDKATCYCLSDFVEEILSKQHPLARQASAKALLSLLCSSSRFSSTRYPYPTRRILECLIKVGDFAPRFVSDVKDAEKWAKLPTVRGQFKALKSIADTNSNRTVTAYEASRFIESHLSMIDCFLKADADPTDSLAYLPRNFVIPMEAMQETIEKSVQVYRNNSSNPESVHTAIVLDNIKIALFDEARRQIEENSFDKKRKRCATQKKEVILLSGEQESDDVIFSDERPIDREKRVKIKEDD